MRQTLSCLLALAAHVHAHGYMVLPMSRTGLNAQAGKDTCPECQILEPVTAWPDLDAAPVGRSGPCGYNARMGVDYNQPGANWGKSPVATYKAGDVINVQWCVDNNGDHGGMFTYRLCPNTTLVQEFLNPSSLPTEPEKQALEDCFEANILPCTSVSGQPCAYNPDCKPGEKCYRNDWFTCNGFNDGTRCRGVDNAPINSCYTSIAGGYTVTKKVKIPDNFPESSHTLLSFKWNSFQTPQIYLSCADVAIRGSSSLPPSTTKSAQPTSTACASPVASMAVTFSVKAKTAFGETIKVVGSTSQLGGWDAAKAKTLSAAGYTDANPVWSGSVTMPAGAAFELKFLRVSGSGTVSWESDPNRQYTVPRGCSGAVTITGEWR
ncbi:carbohydrate-binding module family 20 protein [Sporormia fimetaria CBS 119925]|uniref:Carbohydrate-binding module family 20 protein n=1 Tax=Sporormia fimetaria CBS 119925 TaxID=1340428 RepID=A0A6A6UZI1_9PLEO|nr:carbohydrate-binding module family 20 protein [Sporormia fimetaria CBS 119925]